MNHKINNCACGGTATLETNGEVMFGWHVCEAYVECDKCCLESEFFTTGEFSKTASNELISRAIESWNLQNVVVETNN